MGFNKGKIEAASIVILLVSAMAISIVVPYVIATPQTISINVFDGAGKTITNATVQAFILRPESSGGGYEEIARLQTTDGMVTITNMTKAHGVAREWINTLGDDLATVSSPSIMLFITYMDEEGNTYFKQDSVELGVKDLVSGKSYVKSCILDLSQPPAFVAESTDTGTPFDPASPVPPPPPGAYYYWVLLTDTYYPTSPSRTQVPVAWLYVPGGVTAYGIVSYAMSKTTAKEFSVGVTLGTGADIGLSTTYQIGSSGWTVSSVVDFGDSFGIPATGWGYIYINAQYEASKWQKWFYCQGGNFPTNNYAATIGIVNPEIVNNHVVGGHSFSAPPYYANYTYYNYNLYKTTQGTGSPPAGPTPKIYSSDFVTTYFQNQQAIFNVGIPAGAILGAALGGWAGILAAVLLSVTCTITESTTGTSMAWLQYDAPSGHTIHIYTDITAVGYQTPGGNGHAPLFGVKLTN